ncbi:hypothetical protein LPB72_06240 [Hydrogenophaga crassostreae]|nr:hypothetical protein LPB72_06240 [Hydrogenophaga crassostreae]
MAQQADEQSVKAGFIYNFIRFTQWVGVPDSENKRLLICATSDKPLSGQLGRLSGRTVGSRAIEVRNNVGTGDWSGCDVLFVAQSEADRLDSYLRSLGNAPVLTVGDFAGFTKAGGMIGLRMQDNRVKFDVNLTSAQRANLQLNSQMLKLAGEVLK